MTGDLKSTPADRAAVLGKDWAGNGWTPPTPPPDYADVIAERILTQNGTGVTLHALVADAVREGYGIGYGAKP